MRPDRWLCRSPGGALKKQTPLLALLLPTATMGFTLEFFAEAVDPAFQCQLCGQVLEEPACTPCGHVFWASCLLPWAARRRRCPLQCQPLAPGELYRVLPLRSLVQQLRVQCDYLAQGCSHTVRLWELAAYVQSCTFGPDSDGGSHCPGGCGGGEEGRHQATTTSTSGDPRERPPGPEDRRLQAAREGAAGAARLLQQVPGEVSSVHGAQVQLRWGPRRPRSGKRKGSEFPSKIGVGRGAALQPLRFLLEVPSLLSRAS